MQQTVFRFAPSPNGFLHLGHAYSALLNAELARRAGGRLLLRIEDIDTTRCRPLYEEAIYEDLRWLGLDWEEPVLRQSEHFADYAGALDALKARGLVYPCFCSRRQIAAAVEGGGPVLRDPEGQPLYPGTCRDLPLAEADARCAAGEAHAWRLRMDAAVATLPAPLVFGRFDAAGNVERCEAAPRCWGDVVLARKEVPTSYHLSVTFDDARQGVTHVVRGRDLEGATAIHRLLQELLGWPAPLYLHHALISDADGLKLAKRLRSTPLRELRRDGTTPAQIRAMLPPVPGGVGRFDAGRI